MLDLVAPVPLPDLPSPAAGDFLLGWRGIVPYRVNLSHFPARSGGFFGFGTTSPFCMLHSSASVAGGAPATSGTTDANVIARMQGGSVGLDVGVRPSGVMWIQPRSVGNLAINFGLDICPNGGTADFYGQVNVRGTLLVGSAQQGLVQHDGTNMYLRSINSGNLFLGNGNINYWFIDAAGNYVPTNDNARDLGSGGNRCRVLYAATGAINTSDEREKLWRGAPTDAELDAAWQCFNELGFYQWNDAVDEKGVDHARYHVGLRAQRVWQIFAAAGLVDPIAANGKPGAAAYALFCFDEWDDEFEAVFEERDVPIDVEVEEEYESEIVGTDGEPIKKMRKVLARQIIRKNVDTGEKRQTRFAGNRFGFRPDQLDRLMMAALKRQSDRQEARIAELEAR